MLRLISGRFPFCFHSRCLVVPVRRANCENALFLYMTYKTASQNSLGYIYIAICIISCCFFAACSRSHDNNIIGQWEAASIVVEKRGEFNQKFIISKYGYGNTNISADSSITIKFSIQKDLTVQRTVLGQTYQATLLKAEYESFRRGIVQKTNKVFTIKNYKQNTAKTKLYFCDEFMVSEFTDADSINWKVFWLPAIINSITEKHTIII